MPCTVVFDYDIPDPPLSDLGVQQCAVLRESLLERFGHVAATDVTVIVSPMRRTLQTATIALDWLLERGVGFEANADWQENSCKPCDTGSPVAAIAPDFPHVSFANVAPCWPDKTSAAAAPFAYTRTAILARGQRALEGLYDDVTATTTATGMTTNGPPPNRLIIVVSHSGFLRLAVTGWWFFNADYRVFELGYGDLSSGKDESRPRSLLLRQDESTLTGGLGWSSTERVTLGEDLPDEDDGGVPEAMFASG
ncbi:hypothetical protein RJ55_01538 [Drechmeria coniospora]|nr:hypothetical protein RJ55_01538 [Drechmeria coniospora]